MLLGASCSKKTKLQKKGKTEKRQMTQRCGRAAVVTGAVGGQETGPAANLLLELDSPQL